MRVPVRVPGSDRRLLQQQRQGEKTSGTVQPPARKTRARHQEVRAAKASPGEEGLRAESAGMPPREHLEEAQRRLPAS